jgi:hypothetical protein
MQIIAQVLDKTRSLSDPPMNRKFRDYSHLEPESPEFQQAYKMEAESAPPVPDFSWDFIPPGLRDIPEINPMTSYKVELEVYKDLELTSSREEFPVLPDLIKSESCEVEEVLYNPFDFLQVDSPESSDEEEEEKKAN